MAGPVIEIKCQGSRMAPLGSLVVIQGDLKELSDENCAKLRWRIEHKGFDAPLFVWNNMILDGTQRYRVLTKMIGDGWELAGGVVPVCDIEAADLEEAKDRLLGYVSQYGTLTDEGLYEFLNGMTDPHLESLGLPNFNLEAFRAGWLDDEGAEASGSPMLHPEIGRDAVTGDDIDRAASRLDQIPAPTKQKISVTCPQCSRGFLVDKV
jgi:hypothetical protein